MVATMTKTQSPSDGCDIDKLLEDLSCSCCGKAALDCVTFFPSRELCGQCHPSTAIRELDGVVLRTQSEKEK